MIIYVVYRVGNLDDGTSPIVSLHLSRQEAQEVIHNSVSILKIDEQTIGMGEYPNG